jgi:predicted ATPase
MARRLVEPPWSAGTGLGDGPAIPRHEQARRLAAANGLLFGEVEQAAVPHERSGQLAGLAGAVVAHEGRLVASGADALTGWFEDVRDAFASALDAAGARLRLAVHACPAGTGGSPGHARSAGSPGSAGPAGYGSGGVQDEPLAKAMAEVARLGRAGHGGQVLASAAARQAVGDLLPRAARLAPAGHWLAERPDRATAVFQLSHSTLPGAFPPLRSARRSPGQLPTDDGRVFVGRDHELDRLLSILTPRRLVTVSGTPGAGKSRLVREALHRIDGDAFPDGVRFCDLSTVTGPTDLDERLAAAFEHPVGADRGWGGAGAGAATCAAGLRDELVASLQGRLLLALDGGDHLRAEVAELVVDVLRAGSDATVLVASREPLAIPGEIVIDLGPLGPSVHTGPVDVVDRARAPAAELLVGLAGTGRTAAVDDPVLADLARSTGALPLAIELVAPLVREGEAHLLADRLSGRAPTGGARPEPPPSERSGQAEGPGPEGPAERGLAAVVELVGGELADEEGRLFGALSAFSGGWALAGAEAIGAVVEIEPADVGGLLTRLVERALVRVEGTTEGLPGRYRMLDTLQAEAGARLGRSGAKRATRVHEAHARYFLDLARAGVAPRRTPSEPAWVRAIEAERDNLRAAYRWFAAHGRVGEALELVWSLADDAMMRGHYEVGRWAEALATDPATSGQPLRGAAFALAGNAALVEGDRDRAEQLALGALVAGTERSAGRWLAFSTLAFVAAAKGDEDLCRDRLLGLLQVAQATDDRYAEAVGLYEGVLLARMADRQPDAQWAAQALSGLAREDGSPSLLAIVALGRGQADSWTHPSRARRHLEQGMALAGSARNTLLFLQGLRAVHRLDLPPDDRLEVVQHLHDVAEQFRLRGNATEQVQTIVDLAWHLPELGADRAAAVICGYVARTPFRHLDRFRLVDTKLRERAGRPDQPGGDAAAWAEGAALSPDGFTAFVHRTVGHLATSVA